MPVVALRQVADGPHGCLLTVEFPGDSTGPGLAATLAGAGGDREVWRLDPVTTLERADGLPDHPTLARDCVGEFTRRRSATGPVTVLGYCSAAVFARHVARELGRVGSAPERVLLVAATLPTADTVRAEYAGLLGRLTGGDPAGEPPALADPAATVERWRAELTGHARAFVTEQGFDPDEAESAAREIAGRYLAWLWFLLDAARGGEVAVPCPVTRLPDDAAAVERLGAARTG